MTKTIYKVLDVLAPNAEWTIEGQDYDTIKWLSPNISQPTKEEVQAEIVRLEAQDLLNACK